MTLPPELWKYILLFQTKWWWLIKENKLVSVENLHRVLVEPRFGRSLSVSLEISINKFYIITIDFWGFILIDPNFRVSLTDHWTYHCWSSKTRSEWKYCGTLIGGEDRIGVPCL